MTKTDIINKVYIYAYMHTFFTRRKQVCTLLKIKQTSIINTHAVNCDNREKLKLPILFPL